MKRSRTRGETPTAANPKLQKSDSVPEPAAALSLRRRTISSYVGPKSVKTGIFLPRATWPLLAAPRGHSSPRHVATPRRATWPLLARRNKRAPPLNTLALDYSSARPAKVSDTFAVARYYIAQCTYAPTVRYYSNVAKRCIAREPWFKRRK